MKNLGSRLLILLVVTLLAVVIVATMAASAWAEAIRFGYGPCDNFCSNITVTPSENINQTQHSHPNP